MVKGMPLKIDNIASLVYSRLRNAGGGLVSERIVRLLNSERKDGNDSPQSVYYRGCTMGFRLEPNEDGGFYIVVDSVIPKSFDSRINREELEKIVQDDPDNPKVLPEKMRTNPKTREEYRKQLSNGEIKEYILEGEEMHLRVRYKIKGIVNSLGDVDFEAFWSRFKSIPYLIQKFDSK